MEFMLAAMVGILQLLAKLMDQVVGYYLYFTEAENWSTIARIGVAVLERPGRDGVYPSEVHDENVPPPTHDENVHPLHDENVHPPTNDKDWLLHPPTNDKDWLLHPPTNDKDWLLHPPTNDKDWLSPTVIKTVQNNPKENQPPVHDKNVQPPTNDENWQIPTVDNKTKDIINILKNKILSQLATDKLTNHPMITSSIIKSIKRVIVSCILHSYLTFITPLVTSDNLSHIITCITTFITLIRTSFGISETISYISVITTAISTSNTTSYMIIFSTLISTSFIISLSSIITTWIAISKSIITSDITPNIITWIKIIIMSSCTLIKTSNKVKIEQVITLTWYYINKSLANGFFGNKNITKYISKKGSRKHMITTTTHSILNGISNDENNQHLKRIVIHMDHMKQDKTSRKSDHNIFASFNYTYDCLLKHLHCTVIYILALNEKKK
eukprot:1001953_1